MRLVICSLSITIILLWIFANHAAPLVTPKTINYKLPVHKTLYLNQNISDQDMYNAFRATMEWHEVTNGEVTIDIERLPQKNIDFKNGIILLNVTPDFPDIIALDSTNKNTTLGYCSRDSAIEYIALVNSRLVEDSYTPVLLHELGHALGLEHLKTVDGIGTLMYPSFEIGSNHVTQTDLEQFCQLYKCDATKFHVLPEENPFL